MLTLVKFHKRTPPPNARPGHPVITETLGKNGLIDLHWRPVEGQSMPEDQEFWRVQIIRETAIGQNRGTLIVHPVRKVALGEIRYLQPGFYTSERRAGGNTLIVTPKLGVGDLAAEDVNYILPLELKRNLFVTENVSVIVVCLGGVYWDHTVNS